MLLPILFTLAAPAGVDFYVGTYTSKEGSRGIYRSRLDTATGALSEPALVAESVNPSYLALGSKGKTLYAVNETDAGEASSYAIGKDGGLTLINRIEGIGGAPCHLSVDPKGKSVLIANYTGGSALSVPVEKGGGFGAPTTFLNKGTGPNKGRQEAAHMHAIVADRHSRFAYACDLGTDEVLVFRLDGFELVDRVKTPSGAGPRHFAFGKDGRFAYVNGELDNTVVAYSVDETGPLTQIQALSTLPEGFTGTSHTAEIAVHPSGRWLYVSNRGHDSLAVFEIGKDGTLAPVEIKAPGLKEPRGFEIDPSGRWMVVGGQNSDELLSLPIDPKTGRLGEIAGRVRMSKPVCVVFRR